MLSSSMFANSQRYLNVECQRHNDDTSEWSVCRPGIDLAKEPKILQLNDQLGGILTFKLQVSCATVLCRDPGEPATWVEGKQHRLPFCQSWGRRHLPDAAAGLCAGQCWPCSSATLQHQLRLSSLQGAGVWGSTMPTTALHTVPQCSSWSPVCRDWTCMGQWPL